MSYCLYNAIKTPDGTVLWCQNNHDFKSHNDVVSGEQYINDGLGHYVRRSVNEIPAEDLSVWVDVDNPQLTETVRTAKFWKSYGKDNEYAPYGILLSLKEMTDDHLLAIIKTQHHIQGSVVEKLIKLELNERYNRE